MSSRTRFYLAISSFVIVLAFCELFTASIPVQAGPNEGGVLIVHGIPAVNCTECDCETPTLESCGEAVSEGATMETYWFDIYAAFPSGSSPRLASASFGLILTTEVIFLDQGPCDGSEVVTDDWPYPWSGTVVSFGTPRTGLIERIYYFQAYEYYGIPGELKLAPHPVDGPFFGDDSVPPVFDTIADHGIFGFDVPGHIPCPETLDRGACCRSDGDCLVITPAECGDQEGVYLGNFEPCLPSSCTEEIAACCSRFGICQLRTASDCAESEGVFLLGAESCDPDPCPPVVGACCVSSSLVCQIRTMEECHQSGAFYEGDGTTCLPNPCVTACCFPDGTCTDLSPLYCRLGEAYEQLWPAVCETDPCPAVGACCRAEGIICHILPVGECAAADGTYMGDGSTCDPEACFTACCLANGDCVVRPPYQCSDGYPLEFGTTCDPDPCPSDIGVCCHPPYYICDVLPRTVCNDLDGDYLGDGTVCDPRACWGACCEEDRCEVRRPNFCEGIDGQFLGYDTECDPDPCPTSGAGEFGPNSNQLSLSAPMPNPSTGRFRLTLDLPANGNVVVRLIDIEGKQVGERWTQVLETGRHQLDWPPEDVRLAAGVYYLEVVALGDVHSRRVVVTR